MRAAAEWFGPSCSWMNTDSDSAALNIRSPSVRRSPNLTRSNLWNQRTASPVTSSFGTLKSGPVGISIPAVSELDSAMRLHPMSQLKFTDINEDASDQDLFVVERKTFKSLCSGLVQQCGCLSNPSWTIASFIKKGHVARV
ncbi:hypothetical protein EMCRGX_G001908 [Ephydatia muelleri]